MGNFKDYIKESSKIPIKLSTGIGKVGDRVRLLESLDNYKKGDSFTIIAPDNNSKHIKLGGIGEYSFLDEKNNKICLHAGPKIIDRVFEHLVSIPPQKVSEQSEPKASQARPVAESVIVEQILIQGDKGEQGQRGLQGYIGATGQTGATGERGSKGDKGDVGDRGERGDVGPIGPIGPEGQQGKEGPIGNSGARGTDGLLGPQGTKGDPGEQGETGVAGLTGIAGPIGVSGTKGDTGPIGPEGKAGSSGKIGKTGASGGKGPKGEKGDSGPLGKTGKTGDTGPKGPNGDVGVAKVSYPLKLDNKTLSVEQKFFTELVSGVNSKVSAQGGGGGNVAIFKDGEKAAKAVRSINFTGNVEVTKEGSNHVAVEILGGGSSTTFNTKTGNILLTGGDNITITESPSNTFVLAIYLLDGGSF